MKPARLITIAFSHYCEKARWALDHTRVPYVEESHLPGLHLRPMRRAGGRTVPVLVTAQKTLTDSADILAYADALAPDDRKLYPSAPDARRDVDAIEASCNGELGKAARLFVYHHALPHARTLAGSVRPGLSSREAWALPYLVPLVGGLIRRQYRIDDASAARAADTLRRGFTELGERLGGEPYFVGGRFTAADLTFASLLAPILRPEGHPSMTSAIDDTPPPPSRAHRGAPRDPRRAARAGHVQRTAASVTGSWLRRHAKNACRTLPVVQAGECLNCAAFRRKTTSSHSWRATTGRFIRAKSLRSSGCSRRATTPS